MLTKEEIIKLLAMKGEVKGVVFQTDAKYVVKKEGEVGLKKLEEKVKSLDLPIDYEEKIALNVYPIGTRVISLLLIQEIFGWDENEIRLMGHEAPKTSFIVKLMMKFFVSFKKLMYEVPKYWSEHYTVGYLEVKEVDDVKKTATVMVHDLKIHPVFCKYLEGYFEKIYEFSIDGQKGDCREKKCMFNGDSCHVYELKTKQ